MWAKRCSARQLTSEDVRYVGKLEVAEAAKVIENVQRDINIALSTNWRIFPAMDVDVEDVLRLQQPSGTFTATRPASAWVDTASC